MTNILQQLGRWRLVERVVRLAWGGSRVLAVAGVVLAVACAIDWAADRYVGSETWRDLLRRSRVFAPREAPTAEERWLSDELRLRAGFRMPPNPVADESPMWLRVTLTTIQAALVLWLVYTLIVRPWRRTPPVDDLALTAEKAIRAFDHRLVTAVQLNRPTARTKGMSPALIAEVTREAEDLTGRHNLLKLVDYRRLLYGALILVPVLAGWAIFAAAKPELSSVLVKRQLLMGSAIPRTVHLEPATPSYVDRDGSLRPAVANIGPSGRKSGDVCPVGAEVVLRFRVTGDYDKEAVGRVRVEPDGQPEAFYPLTFEADTGDGAAHFVAKLPPATVDFDYTARLGDGRTATSGRVEFEAPPGLSEAPNRLVAEIILPLWLTEGRVYVRHNDGWASGQVTDAMTDSHIIITARFSKPLARATLVPYVLSGTTEQPYHPKPGDADFRIPDIEPDPETGGVKYVWEFPAAPRMVRYLIDVTDKRGFTNTVPIGNRIQMLADKAPTVKFLPETTAHPDPNDFEGVPDARAQLEWGDKMPLTLDGRVMVIYSADSDQGIRDAWIAYRVIPQTVNFTDYPEEYQKIQHPRDDPNERVYKRLRLKPVKPDPKVIGRFVPDLGLFEQSWKGLTGVKRPDRWKVNVEFYSLPSANPGETPDGLEAGGRYMFEVSDLLKMIPDGKGGITTAKLQIGDRVEIYVGARDKNPAHTDGPFGYTENARLKTVVSPGEAASYVRAKAEQDKRLQDKVDELIADQIRVFLEPERICGDHTAAAAAIIHNRVRILLELDKKK